MINETTNKTNKEEFNLSDKFKTLEILDKKEKKLKEVNYYSENRIKEFIKELKEINQKFWDMGHFNPKTMDEQIDKLIGDELK